MKKDSKTTKRIYNLIIVDESGSMGIIQREALAGMNETIATCQKLEQVHPEIEQRITLITFDSDRFKVHLDNVAAHKAHVLTHHDYRPCGATPLYDAIGKAIAKLNAQTKMGDNVLVTIITDGEENCSTEYNLRMVKNLIDKQKELGWTFALIGTDNLDVEGMAGKMGIANHLTFTEDETSTREMFAHERRAREQYCKCCSDDFDMRPIAYFNLDDDKSEK